MMSAEKKSALFMGFGAFAVVLGAIAVVFWPPLFLSILRGMLVLSPTSQSFEIWQDIPIPIYMEFYMWNLTNVDDILAHRNVTPKFEEMGPYVFIESLTKENLTWNDNGTVTFYNKRVWHYDEERSNGSLSDNITNVNPVVVTIPYITRHQNVVINVAIDVFMRMYHDNMFLTANVSSWLFDGIEDPVLDMASHFKDFPVVIPYDKFAWFYERNNSITYDGVFVLNTGAEDFSQLGQVELWRNSNRTMYRDDCGIVRGSTGELWAPELGQPELEVFVPDICTYMTLGKNRSVEIMNIEGVQYSANYSLFDNGQNYPRMACYCDEVRDADCLPAGALNVSACRYGAPAFVSLPHFLHSDPYYPSKLEGMHPTDEHNFRLALEMFTGIPLGVTAQLQINMLVRHRRGVTINNQFPDPDMLVPMLWFRQELQLTEDYASLARFALNVHSGVPYALYALTAVGIALVLTGVVILVRKLMNSPDTRPILEDQQEEPVSQ